MTRRDPTRPPADAGGLTYAAKGNCPRSDAVYFLWKQLADPEEEQQAQQQAQNEAAALKVEALLQEAIVGMDCGKMDITIEDYSPEVVKIACSSMNKSGYRFGDYTADDSGSARNGTPPWSPSLITGGSTPRFKSTWSRSRRPSSKGRRESSSSPAATPNTRISPGTTPPGQKHHGGERLHRR